MSCPPSAPAPAAAFSPAPSSTTVSGACRSFSASSAPFSGAVLAPLSASASAPMSASGWGPPSATSHGSVVVGKPSKADPMTRPAAAAPPSYDGIIDAPTFAIGFAVAGIPLMMHVMERPRCALDVSLWRCMLPVQLYAATSSLRAADTMSHRARCCAVVCCLGITVIECYIALAEAALEAGERLPSTPLQALAWNSIAATGAVLACKVIGDAASQRPLSQRTLLDWIIGPCLVASHALHGAWLLWYWRLPCDSTVADTYSVGLVSLVPSAVLAFFSLPRLQRLFFSLLGIVSNGLRAFTPWHAKEAPGASHASAGRAAPMNGTSVAHNAEEVRSLCRLQGCTPGRGASPSTAHRYGMREPPPSRHEWLLHESFANGDQLSGIGLGGGISTSASAGTGLGLNGGKHAGRAPSAPWHAFDARGDGRARSGASVWPDELNARQNPLASGGFSTQQERRSVRGRSLDFEAEELNGGSAGSRAPWSDSSPPRLNPRSSTPSRRRGSVSLGPLGRSSADQGAGRRSSSSRGTRGSCSSRASRISGLSDSSSWSSYGEQWEAYWQRQREQELDAERQAEQRACWGVDTFLGEAEDQLSQLPMFQTEETPGLYPWQESAGEGPDYDGDYCSRGGTGADVADEEQIDEDDEPLHNATTLNKLAACGDAGDAPASPPFNGYDTSDACSAPDLSGRSSWGARSWCSYGERWEQAWQQERESEIENELERDTLSSICPDFPRDNEEPLLPVGFKPGLQRAGVALTVSNVESSAPGEIGLTSRRPRASDDG